MTMLETGAARARAEAMLACLRAGARRDRQAAMTELAAFLRLPNDVEMPEAILRNAHDLRTRLEKRGFSVEFWETPSGRPLVFAERRHASAEETLLVYSHYDGVPPGEGWHSDPYQPVLRADDNPASPVLAWPGASADWQDDWRLYARSSADSKNAIIALLSALDVCTEAGFEPRVNLKLLLDGEEERESPGLDAALARHGDRLDADLMISASGERHPSEWPTLALGVRGMIQLRLTLYTASNALHSGHFGGFMPNAGVHLAGIVAALVGEQGRVRIPDFEAGCVELDAEEQAFCIAIPSVEDAIAERYAIARPDYPERSLQQRYNRPSFNLRGFSAGAVGTDAANIIPERAQAEFDWRLSAGMEPQVCIQRLVDYLEALGYPVVRERAPSEAELRQHGPCVSLAVTAAFPATRTSHRRPVVARLCRRLRAIWGERLVIEPSEGGSLPFHRFAERGMPVVCLPISNYDCRQHASDENLRLGHFFQGIEQWLSVLMWSAGE